MVFGGVGLFIYLFFVLGAGCHDLSQVILAELIFFKGKNV